MLTPRRDRMPPTRRLSLTAAVRMIYRVHSDPANLGPPPQPPRPARLAERHIGLLDVPHLTDRCVAFYVNPPDLPGGQPQRGKIPFLGHQLGRAPRGARKLASFSVS